MPVTNNDQLVQYLITKGVLRTPLIIEAFRSVDRKNYVRPEHRADAYGDYPLSIGYGQTISQPTTVAFMFELLQPEPGQIILDVGTGSGWTTALLAHLVGKSGRVWGVELVPELVLMGKKNLEQNQVSNASIQEARSEIGLVEHAPYDRILVSAAATELPDELMPQLKTDGILVCPVGGAIWKVTKRESGPLAIEKYGGFVFVPLVGH